MCQFHSTRSYFGNFSSIPEKIKKEFNFYQLHCYVFMWTGWETFAPCMAVTIGKEFLQSTNKEPIILLSSIRAAQLGIFTFCFLPEHFILANKDWFLSKFNFGWKTLRSQTEPQIQRYEGAPKKVLGPLVGPFLQEQMHSGGSGTQFSHSQHVVTPCCVFFS